MSKALTIKSSEGEAFSREAKIIVKIEGVRWVEKNAGQASGQWAEAYFFLEML